MPLALRSYTDPLHPKQPDAFIVDDFADGREALAEYLVSAAAPLPVLTACDAAEALALARKHLPPVILMDLAMGDVDGWEATRQLKADQLTKHIIVIAVSACVFGPDEVKARRGGMRGVCHETIRRSATRRGAGASVVHGGRSALPAIDALTHWEVS